MTGSIEANYRATTDELRQFVERVERLESEARDIADQKKEVFSEAKARGYDTKVMRKVISLRKREPDDVAEEEAVLDMYCEALGMDFTPRFTGDAGSEEAEDDTSGLV